MHIGKTVVGAGLWRTVAVAGALPLAGSVGVARYVDPQQAGGQVTACVLSVPNPGNNPPLGSVRVIKSTETCKPNETPLAWN